MKRDRGRILAVIACMIVVLSVGATIFVDRELGGWSSVPYWAHLRYIHHVQPLSWPKEPFSPEAWKRSAIGTRYRFAKSILSDPAKIGRTSPEVAKTLGGSIPPDASRWLYPLKPCELQNLWSVLVVEFRNGQVTEVRRDTAWLDP